MYRTLLVPLDGSPASEQAVPVAARLAKAVAATLHLVHIHSPSPHPIHIEGLPVIDDDMRSLAGLHERTYLERHRDALVGEGVHATVARLEGPVAATLVGYAREVKADLLVMTTQGQGGFARLALGSVADAIARCTSTPLLLLRPPHGDQAVSATPFGTVLLPLDGSHRAEQNLGRAIDLGMLDGAKYVLAQVLAPDQADEASARRYLEAVAIRLRAAGRVVSTVVTKSENPADGICAIAREQQADLIALSTHGHSGIVEELLGSVADKVVRGSDLPILLLRAE